MPVNIELEPEAQEFVEATANPPGAFRPRSRKGSRSRRSLAVRSMDRKLFGVAGVMGAGAQTISIISRTLSKMVVGGFPEPRSNRERDETSGPSTSRQESHRHRGI